MTALDFVSSAFLLAAAFFFLAGTVGLLRFPDVYTRLHALTKVDNLALGFVVLALVLRQDSVGAVLKLLLIWGLAMAAGATAAYLVAHHARENGLEPWRAPESEDRS